MKIGHKLILSYLLVALLASLTTFSAHFSYRNIDAALYLVTFLIFILAIGSGIYFSRAIANRIIKLKEASEKVGRGDFETEIQINSNDEIGALADSFNKMVGALRASRAELSAAKNFTDKVSNSMVDFVVVTDLDLTITRVNQSLLKLNGYEERELIGKSANILLGDKQFDPSCVNVLRRKGQVINLDKVIRSKNGSLTPISMSLSLIKDEQGQELGIICVGKDTSERQHQDLERQTIAGILQSVFTTANLDELFEIAHQTINKIIYAENCFIALYNQPTDLIHFRYWKDKYDPVPLPCSPGKNFTSYILRRGKPFLLTRELENQLYESGEVEETGWDSPSWMGVPLRSGSRTIGVLAVQHYEKADVYSRRDLELLAMVGDQLALAIERKRNEIKLKASEAQLSEAQRVARVGSWEWDVLTNKVVWSDEMFRLFGLNPQEFEPTVKNFFSRLPLVDRKSMLRISKKTFDNKLVSSLDHQIIRPDGTALTLQSKGKAIVDETGRVIKMVGTCQDITERKEAEKALQTSEEQHRLLFESNPQPAFVYDLETLDFLVVNDAAVKYYGYSREEFLNNLTLKDIRPTEDIPVLLEKISRVSPERDTILAPSRHRKKDGTVTIVEITSHVLNFAGKRAEIVLVNDITERIKMEEILRKNEADFRDLFDNAPVAYHELDSQGHFTRINKTEESLLGYTNDELKGRHPAEIIVEAVSRDSVKAKLAGRQPLESDERTFIRKDGTTVSCLCTDHLIYDSDGRVTGIRTTLQDITERKEAEKALRASEEQHRLLFETNPQPSYVYDVETLKFLAVNEAAVRHYGYSREEFLNKLTLKDIRPTEDVPWLLERVHRANPNEDIILSPSRHKKKDGSVRDVEVTAHRLVFNGRLAEIVLVNDVTERKKLEHDLRASEESYRAFIEKSTEGIWRYDFDVPLLLDVPIAEQIDFALDHAYLAECNNAMAQMYGFDSAEDLLGTRLRDLLIASDDTNSKYFAEFVKNKYRLNDAETHETNARGEDKYFLNNMVGILEDGKIVSAWGTQRDITERRKAEEQLKIFNEKLQQSNRELQDFAYIASHDLQEPLRKVQAFADRLGSKYADKLDETGLDYLERMRNAAGRMQTLIQDLLSFSRVTTKAQPFVGVNLEQITRDVLSDLEVKIEETDAVIEIENLPELDADPSQMRQLMQNLIGNALKFHRKDAAPVIKIFAEPYCNCSNKNRTKERFCQITVRDNGIGFDEKYLDKIFTVFQRLHGRTEYEGSGVGLAVCRKIVERHGGAITARSAPGEGASFIITLPFKQAKIEGINNAA